MSAPTLMRAVRQAEAQVIRIGRARATRYGLRESWPGLDESRFPALRVSEDGVARSAGEMFTLASRHTVWMPAGAVSAGLPVELADARPSRFLGRHFAAHPDLRLPARLADRSDRHVLLAMWRRGEDLPGNLVLGDESSTRWQSLDPGARTRDDYPELAEATIAGRPPGSWAGGERPKVGGCVARRHRLVTFAAHSADAAARRWCDLLVTEALAPDAVSSHGASAARAQIVATPAHGFLGSERLDRAGARGRVGRVHDVPRNPLLTRLHLRQLDGHLGGSSPGTARGGEIPRAGWRDASVLACAS